LSNYSLLVLQQDLSLLLEQQPFSAVHLLSLQQELHSVLQHFLQLLLQVGFSPAFANDTVAANKIPANTMFDKVFICLDF
jgi:hypothetical protein